jgi:acetylornithine deacetylase/succinyl-diaminopimelate desuccinylase-like protein
MHEAPWAVGETLRQLIDAGHVGDAAICVEGKNDELPVAGKGLGIFEIVVGREGDAVHELAASPELPHPILVGHAVLRAMLDANARFAETSLPYGLGSESYFIGQFESGDFYNRVPVECRIVGTRRYAPLQSFAAVDAELHSLVRGISHEAGATADVKFWRQRDGFVLNPETPVARALRESYALVHGKPLPLAGMQYVADSSIFIREAGVPALQFGTGLGRAHADHEWVELQDVVDLAHVLLTTASLFLGGPV